jgi:hypothetical protein
MILTFEFTIFVSIYLFVLTCIRIIPPFFLTAESAQNHFDLRRWGVCYARGAQRSSHSTKKLDTFGAGETKTKYPKGEPLV